MYSGRYLGIRREMQQQGFVVMQWASRNSMGMPDQREQGHRRIGGSKDDHVMTDDDGPRSPPFAKGRAMTDRR